MTMFTAGFIQYLEQLLYEQRLHYYLAQLLQVIKKVKDKSTLQYNVTVWRKKLICYKVSHQVRLLPNKYWYVNIDLLVLNTLKGRKFRKEITRDN